MSEFSVFQSIPQSSPARSFISLPEIIKPRPLYYELITIKVEDDIYKVPTCAFREESKVFEDMLMLPQDDAEDADGKSDTKPLVLEGISSEDFSCLLKVLYPSPSLFIPDGVLSLSIEQWVSVLKLSHMWSFLRIRLLAIHNLQELDPVRKVQYSTRCEVKEWFSPAVIDLIRRSEPLTPEETRILGFELSMNIMRTRERCLYRQYRTAGSAKPRPFPDFYVNDITEFASKEGLKLDVPSFDSYFD